MVTDGQTEKHDKANSCLSQFFEPKNLVPFSHNSHWNVI